MRILTLHYGWIDFISYDQYIEGHYEYVESIFDDDNAPRYLWDTIIFDLLKVDHIEIIQDHSENYFWTII